MNEFRLNLLLNDHAIAIVCCWMHVQGSHTTSCRVAHCTFKWWTMIDSVEMILSERCACRCLTSTLGMERPSERHCSRVKVTRSVRHIQGSPRNCMAHFLYDSTPYALTSSTIDRLSNMTLNSLFCADVPLSNYSLTHRLSNFFHCLNQENICNDTVTKAPTTLQVCRYTTLWNVSVLKATIIENKTTSVATHFKKLTAGKTCLLSQILSKVTVASFSFYTKCSMCQLDDALLKCVVTEVVLFSIVTFKTLTFHKLV